MKTLIQKITPAILDSRKIRVNMDDGHNLIVHPHIVVRKKEGSEILKSMLDNGDCMDIPPEKYPRRRDTPREFCHRHHLPELRLRPV